MGLQDPTAVTVLVLWAALPLPPALHCRCCCRCRKDPAPPLPPWQQERLLRRPGHFRWAEGSAGGRGPSSLGGRAAPCRARRATGTSRGAPVRACKWRWVECFMVFSGSLARSALDFFSPSLQKSVWLLWTSCLFGSLTRVVEVSSAVSTAFLIKSCVLIGCVFYTGPGARHARIFLFGAFEVFSTCIACLLCAMDFVCCAVVVRTIHFRPSEPICNVVAW